MILNTFWIVIFVVVGLYYVYVIGVMITGKKQKVKKDENNDNNLQINDNFVNNTSHEHNDLDAILNQVEKSEKNSALLEAFKSGSKDVDNINSLTQKKDETFKIIRNTSAENKDPDSGT